MIGNKTKTDHDCSNKQGIHSWIFFYVLNHISINETSVRVIKDQIGYSAMKNSPSNASASYLSHVPDVSLTETANEKENMMNFKSHRRVIH